MSDVLCSGDDVDMSDTIVVEHSMFLEDVSSLGTNLDADIFDVHLLPSGMPLNESAEENS